MTSIVSVFAAFFFASVALADSAPALSTNRMSDHEEILLQVKRPIELKARRVYQGLIYEANVEHDVRGRREKANCFFKVAFDPSDLEDARMYGRFPVYVVERGFIKLKRSRVNTEWLPGESQPTYIEGVNFNINPRGNVAQEPDWLVLGGVLVSRQDHRATISRAMELNCRGSFDLRWVDLDKIFGVGTFDFFRLAPL